jgi:arsenate reductase-like glutaredoxin family protein
MSCTRSQEYLAKAGIEIDQRVDARKHPIEGKSALKLLNEVDELYVAKGKAAIRYNLKKDAPSQETLLAAILGPTGNLRAPTLRKGRTLIVGFNPAMYEETLA